MITLIFSYLKDHWKNLSGTKKVMYIIALLFFSYGVYLYGGKAYYKYKYYQGLEKQVGTLKDSIVSYKEAELKLIEGITEANNRAKKKSKDIHTKLKKDEEVINNSTVTPDELDGFLSRFED